MPIMTCWTTLMWMSFSRERKSFMRGPPLTAWLNAPGWITSFISPTGDMKASTPSHMSSAPGKSSLSGWRIFPVTASSLPMTCLAVSLTKGWKQPWQGGIRRKLLAVRIPTPFFPQIRILTFWMMNAGIILSLSASSASLRMRGLMYALPPISRRTNSPSKKSGNCTGSDEARNQVSANWSIRSVW